MARLRRHGSAQVRSAVKTKRRWKARTALPQGGYCNPVSGIYHIWTYPRLSPARHYHSLCK